MSLRSNVSIVSYISELAQVKGRFKWKTQPSYDPEQTLDQGCLYCFLGLLESKVKVDANLSF
jgi:hypothetical protein